MNGYTIIFTAKLWLYGGEVGWHFVSVPKVHSAKIKKAFAGMTRGFGSVPVLVQIGSSEWKTSIFPDSKSGMYLLPVKAVVRKKESLVAGSSVLVQLTVQIDQL